MGSLNPWEDSRFRGEEYYGWIKSLPADTLRRAAFQHGLLGPLGSDIMSELTALEASGAAKHNDRLLQHIIPHGAKSFQMFLGVLSELDYHLEVTKFSQLFTPLPALSGAMSMAATQTGMGRTLRQANSASKDSASVVHNTTNVYINTSGGQQDDIFRGKLVREALKCQFERSLKEERRSPGGPSDQGREDASRTGSPRQPVPPPDVTLTAASVSMPPRVGTPPIRVSGESTTSASGNSDHGGLLGSQTALQERTSDPDKLETKEAPEMLDAALPSADEVAAPFNPWTHPDYPGFHDWILGVEAFSLRNNAIGEGLLSDHNQVLCLQARERDGWGVHNEQLLSYVIPGGRDAFVKLLAAVARSYPHKSEEFKRLLTPP